MALSEVSKLYGGGDDGGTVAVSIGAACADCEVAVAVAVAFGTDIAVAVGSDSVGSDAAASFVG
jgi:hypothetical protein